MIRFDADVAKRRVSFAVPKSVYSTDALRIAAQVFSGRAEAYAEDERREMSVTLEARRKDADAAALEALAGEFLNEMLNQEYRMLTGRFNRRLIDLVVTQALLCARGGDDPPPPPTHDAAFEKEAAKLVSEAEEEVRRTMPAKRPPQGPVLPPHDA